MKLSAIITFIILCSSLNLSAQKIKFISGTPELLKSESYMGFDFTYKDLYVKDLPEIAYLKKENYDEESLKEWEENKNRLYPVQFLSGFNKGVFKGGIYMTNKMESPYSLRMDVNRFDMGDHQFDRNIGTAVEIDVEIFETGSPMNLIAVFRITKCYDEQPDLENNDETFYLGKAFYNAGYEMGKYLAKKHL